MRLLLDTHIVLWWLANDPRVRPIQDTVIEAREVFVSAVTPWELGIKQQRGTLRLTRPIESDFAANHFKQLAVTFDHARQIGELPHHHRDPFDRMLVAQCMVERLTLVTHDKAILAYPCNTLKV